MGTIAIVEGVVLVLLATLVVGLLRSRDDLLRRLRHFDGDLDVDAQLHQIQPRVVRPGAGEAAGGPAHNISGLSLDGEAIEIGLVGAPRDAVLAFLSATCYTCEPFWATLAAGVDVPGRARIVVVVQDGDDLPRLRRLAGDRLLVVRSDAAWSAYQVPGSPHFAYVVGPTGRVAGEGTAPTWAQIGDLLEQAHGASRVSTAPAVIDLSAYEKARDHADRTDDELLTTGPRRQG